MTTFGPNALAPGTRARCASWTLCLPLRTRGSTLEALARQRRRRGRGLSRHGARLYRCGRATKVWTRGRQAGITQMERSFALLKVKRIDLMQVHNLVDWQTHLATLRRWKQDGRIRYFGVTHYTASAYDELEAVMRKEAL